MLRRLSATFLSLSLALSATAGAQQFAQAPSAGAPAPHAMRQPDLDDELAPVSIHAPSRALVMRALAKRRAENLTRFHAYRKKGVFPHDLVAQTTQNIWRDTDGHLCAAATIIDADGQHDLVQQIADSQNYVKLGEVTSGPLLDWIMTSGFTQVELSTIQEPFMGPREPPKPRDDSWRIAEDARLRRKYARIEKMLRENTNDALAQAADRLADNPTLAWQVVGGELDVEVNAS
jgi:hypothetical protein